MTLPGEEKTSFQLHCSQCAKPSKSHMQLVIINGGIVSTCRGCDRQTHHPHISIQLEIRRQEELSFCVQTSQQAWTLFHPFSGSNTAHYPGMNSPWKVFTLAHASSKAGDHITYLKAEWKKFSGSQTSTQHMNSWTREMRERWMNEIHIFKSLCEAQQ